MKHIQVEGEQTQVLHPITATVFPQWSPADWESRLGICNESCVIVCMALLKEMLQTILKWNQWKVSVNCWMRVLLQNMCWLTGGLSSFAGCSFVPCSCLPGMMSMQLSFTFIFLHENECFQSKEDFIYHSPEDYTFLDGSFSNLRWETRQVERCNCCFTKGFTCANDFTWVFLQLCSNTLD